MASHRIWEWLVDRGAGGSPVGVSGTRDRAMQALSRTLIASGRPASGRIVPVILVDGVGGASYLRLGPVLTADHDSGVIRWH